MSMLQSLISPQLLREELPVHYVPPKFNLYGRTEDPTEHIYHFRQLMALVDDREGLLCRVFLASLQGSSLTWFYQLPTCSIHSFAQLCDQFMTHYACNIRSRSNIDHLFNLK